MMKEFVYFTSNGIFIQKEIMAARFVLYKYVATTYKTRSIISLMVSCF